MVFDRRRLWGGLDARNGGSWLRRLLSHALPGLALVAVACGGGAVEPSTIEPDAGADALAPAESSTWGCDMPAPVVDFCSALPTGTVVACTPDKSGTPSQDGYLEIKMPDGSRLYTCATSWTDNSKGGGYWFEGPDEFMSDPQSCCGGAPTPVTNPPMVASGIGGLTRLHGAREIKPQESADPGDGPLRHNPFAVVVRDRSGAAAYSAALANWQIWSTDGNPHPGDDGTGEYYFVGLGVNFVLVETPDGHPTLVIGPEVSTTSDGSSPLGHPTLGACPGGGGAPLVMMGGEIVGTTIDNHSGRFNHDPTASADELAEVAKLFNCYGISITGTTYYPPKN
jgi:hypothetical protein